MKKFFAIAILATAFVACNNSSDKKAGEGDTTKNDTATTAPVTPPVEDTANKAAQDTANKAPKDTATKM